MPTISALTVYPIKSCAGMAVQRAQLTRAGLAVESVYDREWMVVDAAGRFLSQREHPRMALIVPHLKAETLELRAPGMLCLEIPLGLPEHRDARSRQVQVWDDSVLAYDCDELTATWFSNAIGVPCRLVRFHADGVRFASEKWTGGVEAPTMFSDGYPALLISQGSLDDLNGRLEAAGRSAIPMNRFRPNIVIDGVEAFEEDFCDSFTIGAAELRNVKPCPRCPMPAVDQATGVVGPDPMDIMQTYRAKPIMDGAVCFGVNLIVTSGEGEWLRVGQEIYPQLAF